MDKNVMIKVVNRGTGPVGYNLPELRIRRQFRPREEKTISFEELQALYFAPGGQKLLEKYIVIRDEEALKELFPNTEPEYYYTAADVKYMLTKASMAEFLDCLDFAPGGVLDMLQDMAVDMELNDIKKRNAILNKLGLDVTKAIEIKNTKYDGDSEATEPPVTRQRRTAAPTTETTTSERRTAPPKYNVVE